MSNEHEHEHSHCDHCESNASPKSIAINPDAKGGKISTFKVAGMDCADEVAALERVLKPIKGVSEIKVSLMTGTVGITHDPSVSDEALIKAIGAAGLKASVPTSKHGEEASESAQRARLITVDISGICTAIGLLLQWTKLLEPWGKIGAFTTAIITGGWFILPKAIRALRRFALDMNVLMTVAVIGAAAIGEWSEGAAGVCDR